MTTSDPQAGDRPVRRHFNKIVIAAFAFMALVIVLASLFFHFNKTAVAPLSRAPGTPQADPANQQ